MDSSGYSYGILHLLDFHSAASEFPNRQSKGRALTDSLTLEPIREDCSSHGSELLHLDATPLVLIDGLISKLSRSMRFP